MEKVFLKSDGTYSKISCDDTTNLISLSDADKANYDITACTSGGRRRKSKKSKKAKKTKKSRKGRKSRKSRKH